MKNERARAISIVTVLAVVISGVAGGVMPIQAKASTVSQNQIMEEGKAPDIITSDEKISDEKVSDEKISDEPELSADSAQPAENTYYLLVSKATGKAMSVEGYSDGNSVGICQMDIGNYKSQVWSLKKVTKEGDANAYYQIVNYYSGKALNVPNNSAQEGTQIIQWNPEKNDNGIWKLTALSDGSYRISSRHKPDFSIKVKDGDTERGAARRGAEIVQSSYTEGDNDGWELRTIAESAIQENPGLETPDPEKAIEAYMAKFDSVDGKGRKQIKCYDSFWADAEMVEVLIDAYEHLGGEKYKGLMVQYVDGFLERRGTNWKWNGYNDDVMWATIMCARAYLLTGDEKYLDCAKENFAIAYNRGYTDELGGGLRWKVPDEGETPTKNSCANGPAAIAACLLGEATGDETYFEKARGIIDWQVTILYEAEGENAGKVYDSVNINREFNYWASTYNQGTFIGACTMLYQHYGQQKYFDYANNAAKYAATKLGSGTEGYLNCEQDGADLIGFKGILARWISYFAINCNVDTYKDWMYQNAASAWTNRNSDNLMWTQFGKFTEEKLEESTEKLGGNNGNETVGNFAAWGCSTAVAWLVDCTNIDTKQEKKQQQTESPGVTAGEIALQKVVTDKQALYEAGQGNCPAYAWKEFTDAYEAALNPAADVTAAELKALQEALEKASTGLSNVPGNVIEAESGVLKGGVDIVNAANCSGGKRIGNIGDGMNKTATYSVFAGRTGEHKLSIYFCTASDRQLNVVINGKAYPVSCKSNGSWDKPTTNPAVITATLNKGENTIVFGGIGTNFAPNVDYFLFEKVITEEDTALDGAEEALEEVLTQYEFIVETGGENYTEESYQTFQDAYDGAVSALYGREDVTAKKLEELQDALTKARKDLEAKKPEGTGSVMMEDWVYGDTPKAPVPVSETNGTDAVTYQYKVRGAANSTYTDTMPVNAGDYMVKATFATTESYYKVIATDDFTIERRSISGGAVVVEDGLPYNGRAQSPVIKRVSVLDMEVTTYDVDDDSATDAGNYRLTITGTGNFKDVITANWSIDKADYNVDLVEKYYLCTIDHTDAVNLREMLPNDCGTVSYGTPDIDIPANGEEIIFKKAPVIEEGVLSYAIKSGKAEAVSVVSIGIKTKNYEDIRLQICLKLLPCQHEAGDVLYTGDEEKAPTCTENGVGHKECSKCGETIERGIVTEATGHKGGTATCAEKAVCVICAKNYGQLSSVHIWNAGVVIKNPTTDEKGLKTYTCNVCGTTKSEDIHMLEKDDDGKDEDTRDDNKKDDDNSTIGDEDEELPEGVEATAQEAEKNITSANTDKGDVKGSTFAKLQLKATGKNKSVKLTWKKVKGASGYIVYGAQCGKQLKKIKTLKGASKISYTHKKLKKAKYYKYVVVAYKTIKGKKYILTSSKSAHVVTTGDKYASPTEVTVKSAKISVKKGKNKTINASYKLPKNKKTKVHIAKFRYESSNTKVATVSKNGVVKGKKKGTAYIYVYTQNGVCKKVKVTVK